MIEIQTVASRSQIDNFRQNNPAHNHDCIQIEIMLREDIPKFTTRYTNRYFYYVRKSLANRYSNVPMVENFPLSIFLIDDKPIVELSLYNIFANTNKVGLKEYLKIKGAYDFKIVNITGKKGSRSAIICCRTSHSACKLQCLACDNELDYQINYETLEKNM